MKSNCGTNVFFGTFVTFGRRSEWNLAKSEDYVCIHGCKNIFVPSVKSRESRYCYFGEKGLHKELGPVLFGKRQIVV